MSINPIIICIVLFVQLAFAGHKLHLCIFHSWSNTLQYAWIKHLYLAHKTTVYHICHMMCMNFYDKMYVWHDDVIKWKHFPRNCQFVRGIHRSPVTSPHKGQWRVALMFSLICVWINDWVNNREAGDLRRYCAHYDVIVMIFTSVNSKMSP